MSWKESKVRLLPPPTREPQNKQPDIQDLFLLASQATALRNSDTIKIEQVIQPSSSSHAIVDSAMMPPPPVPPPRRPASPGVSSTSGEEPSSLLNESPATLGKAIFKFVQIYRFD